MAKIVQIYRSQFHQNCPRGRNPGLHRTSSFELCTSSISCIGISWLGTYFGLKIDNMYSTYVTQYCKP